jgi:hypothetical protein
MNLDYNAAVITARAANAAAGNSANEVGRLRGELTRICDSLRVVERKNLDYIDVQYGDTTYIVGCEYEPAERQTFDDPGRSESISVCEVWCRGIDISDILGPLRCEEMAENVSEALKAARQSAKDEAQISQREFA